MAIIFCVIFRKADIVRKICKVIRFFSYLILLKQNPIVKNIVPLSIKINLNLIIKIAQLYSKNIRTYHHHHHGIVPSTQPSAAIHNQFYRRSHSIKHARTPIDAINAHNKQLDDHGRNFKTNSSQKRKLS